MPLVQLVFHDNYYAKTGENKNVLHYIPPHSVLNKEVSFKENK